MKAWSGPGFTSPPRDVLKSVDEYGNVHVGAFVRVGVVQSIEVPAMHESIPDELLEAAMRDVTVMRRLPLLEVMLDMKLGF